MKPLAPDYSQKIPMLDLSEEIRQTWDEYTNAFQKVMGSGQFILGPEVRTLEEEVARYIGVKHAIGMNSGTDALVIGLRALGIAPDDEVITSPFSFFATGEAISQIGATPVFVDIEPKTFNLDPALVAKKITAKTKAIMPVHLFGQAAEMNELSALSKAKGIKILEDAAQALGGDYEGKKIGSFGEASAFSFFPTKNLGAFGDGGMLATNDDGVAERARMLRVHGSKVRYHHDDLGYTSRLDEMQAAFLRIKLRHLDERNEKRRQAASRYHEALQGLPGLTTPYEASGRKHIFHQYTIVVPSDVRDRLQTFLTENGVSTIIYYPIPIHRTKHFNMAMGLCPITEGMAQQVLSLPMWPEIPAEVQARITGLVRTFWQKHL